MTPTPDTAKAISDTIESIRGGYFPTVEAIGERISEIVAKAIRDAEDAEREAIDDEIERINAINKKSFDRYQHDDLRDFIRRRGTP